VPGIRREIGENFHRDLAAALGQQLGLVNGGFILGGGVLQFDQQFALDGREIGVEEFAVRQLAVEPGGGVPGEDGARSRGGASGRASAAAEGRIAITGPTCMTAYLGDPAATAAVLAPAAGSQRTFLTADRGRLDGLLTVTGRIDDVVQSGGAAVDLAGLQTHLDAVCGPGRVAAFAVADATWGARIMAAAVEPVTADGLARLLAGRVAPAARPQAVLQVEAMPLTASGKLDRRRLAQAWEEAGHGHSR
jgi:acyl-CoA synthetase (AMP-forming)/AMP-acid ligase II